MENNNIDDFFRQHSHTMDEAPGEALWQRIESRLPLITAAPTSSKTNFSGSKFLLVLVVTATMIVAGIVFIRSNDKNVLQPAVTKVHTTITETLTKQDTIKKKKILKNAKSKKQGIPFTTVKRKCKIVQDTVDNLMADTPAVRISPQVIETKPVNVVKTNTTYNPKRTVITINEVVTQHVFDSITAANIEKYKNNPGMHLIVKEPRSGHIFRTKFENTLKQGRLTFEQKKDSTAINGMKLVLPKNTKNNVSLINIKFDSLKIPKKTLKAESIKLKLDSIVH